MKIQTHFIWTFIFTIMTWAGEVALAASNSMNPAIGINALTTFSHSNRGDQSNLAERNGMELSEVEIQFSADVDPYWRLVSYFSLHPEVSIDTSTTPQTRSQQNVFEAEELYAETLALSGLTYKVGKFKAAFGRHNTFHTHAYPFIQAPLNHTILLGEEGLNDVGVSLSAMVPLSWYSEVTAQALSGQGEGLDYFHSGSANSLASVLRWQNLWDLSEDLTFHFGLSAADGENSANQNTSLYAGDFTLKWRPSPERALIWTTEYIQRQKNGNTTEEGRGVSSWLQGQLTQRWWLGLRLEQAQLDNQDPGVDQVATPQMRNSFLVAYVPSEFSAIRLQYDQLDDGSVDPERKLMLQFNFSIGAHPAHSY